MSFNTIKKLVLKIKTYYKNENIEFVLYGGEPMLHPDIYKIICFLSQYGHVTVQTNGLQNCNFLSYIDCDVMTTLHDIKYLKQLLNNTCKLKNLNIVFLLSAQNYVQMSKLYSILKKSHPISIGYVFQDIKKIPNSVLKNEKTNILFNGQNVTPSYLIRNNITNFYGCDCTAGKTGFVIDFDENIFRCDQEFINDNPVSTLDEYSINNIYKKCTSKWCAQYEYTVNENETL